MIMNGEDKETWVSVIMVSGSIVIVIALYTFMVTFPECFSIFSTVVTFISAILLFLIVIAFVSVMRPPKP